MSRRRRPSSPSAASPLDDNDLLPEILLRLPPDPSSLPRASAVCTRWRSIASDAGFSRRFRRHHRRSAPLLGVFLRDDDFGLSFQPTLDAPNRVPPARFSLHRDDDDGKFIPLGCRHGLVLVFLPMRLSVLVWDPVTGDQHRVAVPAGFATHARWIGVNGGGAVLRAAAGDGQHFQVVLVVVADNKDTQDLQIVACVYSSETGSWGTLVSTPIPYYQDDGSRPTVSNRDDAVLAGDSLYWKLVGDVVGILEFDLEKQSLAVIQVPAHTNGKDGCLKIMQAVGGGLGLLFETNPDHTAQLWKRETDSDGVASWGLARTVELGKILSLKPVGNGGPPLILGFAEENNAVFLFTPRGLFIIYLDSLKFKMLDTMTIFFYHPFEGVYASGI